MRLNKVLIVGCLMLGFPAASFSAPLNPDELFTTGPKTPQAAGAFERTVAKISDSSHARDMQLIEIANSKIAAEPNNDKYFAARAQCYLNLSKNSEALADINRAISLNSRNSSYYELRAFLRSSSRDYESAVHDLTLALTYGPATADLYMKRASFLGLLHRYSDSLKDYDAAIAARPNSQAYALRGMVKLDLRNYDGALSDCEKSESLESGNSTALRLRAQLKTMAPFLSKKKQNNG